MHQHKFFRKIMKRKLQSTPEAEFEKYRLKTWTISSDTINQMEVYKHYYSSLMVKDDGPTLYNYNINADIERTQYTEAQFTNLTPARIQKYKVDLYQILTTIAKRNMLIGYCQGFNQII